MIEYVKSKLISNPNKIKELLEEYNYCSVKMHCSYITCARDEHGSNKSIIIRLVNNDALLVHDYPKNIIKDIFAYISISRNTCYKDVLKTTKHILGITDHYVETRNYKPFGGFYDKIHINKTQTLTPLKDGVLDSYMAVCNERFLNDGISLTAQRYFNIGYSIEEQCITIPIYDEEGNLVGVKARTNEDNPEGSKYYYLVPTFMSQTLYGFSHNYEYLVDGEVIIFESEKSCMQCFSFGIRNCVALGSSSISKKQTQMILSLHPSKIILAHDKSLPFETVEANIKTLLAYGRMKEFELYYVDIEKENDIPDKSSPSDLGLDRFKEIINNNLIKYER